MEGSRGAEGGPSRRLSRTFTTGNFDIMDPEVVPSSLAAIAPILRVANEIEEKSPRVAYLCRFYAFDKAHKMDPTSSGRGVRQFKTALLHKLEKDDAPTRNQRVNKSDAREMQTYYEKFYNDYVKSLETAGENMDRAQLAKAYQTASVLFDVLKAVNQSDVEQVITKEEEDKFAKELETKTKKYGSFNILPLDPDDKEREKGVAIISLNEIMAAVNGIRNTRGLDGAEKEITPIHDILDWLQLKFGFQKDNVANQRENLILLLANVHVRISEDYPPSDKLDDKAVEIVYQRLFKNYVTWCKFIGRPSSLVLPKIQLEQRKLLYMALFLLIWGEAANLRFMPESLCYIFHHMARELHGLLDGKVSTVTGESVLPAYGGETNSFLDKVIKPIYDVVAKEVTRYHDTKVRHSTWRNYDDLNEYFWSSDCFRLGWPMRIDDNFFRIPERSRQKLKDKEGKQSPWNGKSGFVEVRSFWHIFRSFDRMWSFLILSLQAMVIVAWNGSGSLGDIFKPAVFKKVLSILITAAFLRLVQAIIDVFLSIRAWRSTDWTGILRYILKVIVAFAWMVILPLCYARTWGSPVGILSAFESWFGNTGSPSLYVTAILIYLAPDAFGTLLFFFPSLRRTIEKVDHGFVKFLLWWSQQPLFIGRGMHEDPMTLFLYTFFWILLLVSKLLFSYYVEILPLIKPTKDIMEAPVEGGYQWHEFFPYAKYNIGVVVAIWSPIILVYFMDTQIWYALMSTVWGGITGAFSRLGEIRSVEMLRSRFQFLPSAFNENLVPSEENEKPARKKFSLRKHYESFLDDNAGGNGVGKEHTGKSKLQFARFSQLWNEVIQSLREEDYISNEELELLTIPRSTDPSMTYLQWPPFLLANKIVLALDTVKDFTSEMKDEELMKRFENDKLIIVAIRESYDLLKKILTGISTKDDEKKAIENLINDVEGCVNGRVLESFTMKAMPLLHEWIVRLVDLLHDADSSNRQRVALALQNLVEVYSKDVREGNAVNIRDPSHRAGQKKKTDSTSVRSTDIGMSLFAANSIEYPLPKDVMDKIKRLRLLLTVNESGMDIPVNREARRRISYFTNSLFMDMPQPRKIPRMRSFSVLTPYFNEEILYTRKSLEEENEDGVSILFYLQKIYPDEWKNFKQRENIVSEDSIWDTDASVEAVRRWASYRAQTLTRTVRGMMYYRRAIKLLAFFDLAKNESVIMQGYDSAHPADSQTHSQNIDSIADLKFTYVVTCQKYGIQKRTEQEKAHNIFNLMKENPSLRVAYIDEVDEKEKERTYYSKLVKVIKDDNNNATEQEIYSIKLPGNPILGEGKPENQNHAIIFTRGEALQAIDMNQDHYLEEALKMRNLLEEFSDEKRGPSVLGMREHIFTGSVSSLANFMSKQESSFVTIGQRVLANPLKVRFHYGHPDVFERLFHITRGGISKASKGINLSEDIFAGFNTTLRGGNVTHHEYIQVGKGRDVGLNQISLFEAKIANGNGEQTISRDVYRLGHRMDFFRMLSVYYTTVGFYFSNLIIVLTVYVFLYGRIYLALSGLDASLSHFAGLENNTSLQAALASQSFVQIGLLMALPMVMEIGLERGFRKAFSDFVIMQLQLASVFFTFSMGTKVHFYGRTILHGGAKYRSTGRGFVVFHAKFAENYRLYSRSHFTKGIELLILLIVYDVYGTTVNKTIPYLLITFSLWFLVGTWLFAPFLFNPSGFEWQKIVDDWDDWTKWVNNRGGIGVSADKSWESWWIQEHEHLRISGFRGQFIEILLSTRFLLYQYGLVYHLNIASHNKSILVYALSWIVIIVLLFLLKIISHGRRRLSADFQLFFRLMKGVMFVITIAIFIILFLVGNLTIGDIFAGLLAFLPSGWAIIQISQVCSPAVKKIGMWESVMSLARIYEYIMGFMLFAPVAILAWFPFISDFQTRLLFNQAFSRGLQISRILAGRKDKKNN